MANPTYQSGFYAPGRGTAKYPELWDGCVGAWNPGLGNTGLSLRDWSGNGRNATLTHAANTAWTTKGITNNNTANASCRLGNFGAFPSRGTICYWVMYRSWNFYDNSFGMNAFANNNIGIRVELPPSRELYAYLGNAATGSSGTLVPFRTIEFNQFYHLAITWDVPENKVSTFVDGSPATSGATVTTWAANMDDVRLGQGYSATRVMNGIVNDCMIFTRALSPNEVRTLAQRPGIAYERAPRKFYSLPAAASSRQYRLFRPAILRGA
jgi:hypothetical protein